MTEAQLKLIGVAVAAAALFAAGATVAWIWQANAYGTVIAANEASRQADLASIASAGAEQARTALAKQQDAEQRLAALDRTATEEKVKTNAENETLRRAVADGARRLRIAGSCGSGGGNVSKATSASGVGDAGSVELSAAAGRSVFDIRAGIIGDQAALRAAQDYIRTACTAH
ncbi:lysis protein [Pseudomonas sp. KU26590]|uniref:lysis system i-spanin subunit Rz n=1 Tax=Pseudomonas sp. KU26590 TaxID=2991051 RepID=UPI00223CFC88|nr:lysis system i-spanin subunit Rz [Pseudomonas sp. KU26590]UZJ58185.1 lysis protein [Pseudomonas sp. KU26590]